MNAHYIKVMQMIQEFEEMGTVETTEEYVEVLSAIRSELDTRIAVASALLADTKKWCEDNGYEYK